MPTYERAERFTREWRRLVPEQQIAFLHAVEHFVQDLRRGRFRKGLRVKAVQGRRGWWEVTRAPNGRALFNYGTEVHPGEKHVIWQRIGGHEIFE